MDSQRDVAGEGLAEELIFRQALLIQAVPHLMHRPVEGIGEPLIPVSGGEACIARANARAEGVGRNIEPASIQVKAHLFQHIHAELMLLRGINRNLQRLLARGTALFGDSLEQFRQTRSQRREYGLKTRGRRTWFVIVNKLVVGFAARGNAVTLRLATHQTEHFLKPWRERREIIFLACNLPDFLRLARCLGNFSDQIAGKFGSPVVIVPSLADVGRCRAARLHERVITLAQREQLAHARVR